MKKIILIRHSKTEVIYDGISDLERNLKPRGRNDSRLIATDLKIKGFIPQLILSSNANRAIQTAYEIAKVFNYPADNIIKESFLYNGYTTSEFLKYTSKLDNSINSVCFVAHNPDIALLGINLSNGDFFHFPTSATVVISFDADKWSDLEARTGKAEYFITPLMLKDIEN
ncbi:MAG: histidine phosphatase family protein [Marinilabiliaceae bacterium]|nr:histidine phosphatase family protein [Marinilabiliaceae bacterium]